MKWSFKILSVFGIEIRIHITFFLILAWVAYIWGVVFEGGTSGAVYGAFLVSLLFVCVIIHELCHSRMAQHYGADVASITLLPIGGVSLLKNMPEEPRKELWVSLVGPLSNVVIAMLLGLVFVVIPGNSLTEVLENPDLITSISLEGMLAYLLLINLMLAIFNLLPAFPLDGGRVLRSILAQYMDYVDATHIAVIIGQAFAFILGIGGLLTGQWLWIIIAIFIYMGAEQEGAGSEMKTTLSRLNVGQAVSGNAQMLSPANSLSQVVTMVLHGFQEDFPVVDEKGQITGMLTRANLIRGLHEKGPEAQVGEVMEKSVPVLEASAPFSKAYEKMNETGVKAVIVMEDGQLKGIVTLEHMSEVFMLLTSTNKPITA